MPVHRVVKLGLVNAYLVHEEDGLTLVDTMLPRSEKKILAAAEPLGAPIVRIALTHAHGDHIGSLDALAAALPEAEVLISARDARLLAKDMSLDPGEPQDKLRGRLPRREDAPSRTFEPGERIGSLEVHAAPGHTPGQVAFLDTRDGTLYCADAYSTLGGVATSAKPNWRFPLPALATWHKPTALERPAPCARSTPPGWRRATARSSRRRAPRWTARSPRAPERGAPRPRPRAGRRRRRRDRGRRRARGRHARPRRRSARRALAVALQPRRGSRGPGARHRHRSTRELATALRRAATGRAGTDAIAAVARRSARTRSPIPAATPRRSRRPRRVTPSTRRPRPTRSTCSSPSSAASGREGDELIHAVRALRSAVHGFAALEAAGGFGLAVDPDVSFRRLVDALARGIG